MAGRLALGAPRSRNPGGGYVQGLPRVGVGGGFDDIEFDPSDLSSFTTLEGRLLELVRRAQEEVYGAELASLVKRGSKGVKRTSSLLPFSPILDHQGILRVGGRLDRLPMPYATRHPVILPPRHPLSMAILTAFHRRLNHMGVDLLLAESRQFFWIIRGRELCKKVRKDCHDCALRFARPATQQMANFFKERAEVYLCLLRMLLSISLGLWRPDLVLVS
jgi:hypothetical protein